MRTTFEIDEKIIHAVMKASKAKTKNGAIVIAMEDYLRSKRRQELKDMIGAYDTWGLSLKDLKKMRRDG